MSHRTSSAHLKQQAYRFARLFAATLVTQALAQLAVNGDVSQWDRKAVIALIVAAAEAAWRQVYPTTPPAPVDPPLTDQPADPVTTATLARLDPRLGRHVEHDERSRNFPARTAPVVKTTRHRHYGRVLDQGQLGSCTGNALIDCLMTAPLHKTGRVLTEGDAVKVYELATTLDSIPGAYPPSDTGSSGLAACKAAQRLGLISGYRHAFGVDECLAALTLGPVMIGIPWYSSMFNPAADGTLTVSGNVAGGHEVALIGVDARKRTVTLLNSWGSGWGLNGRAYLSWADLDRLLSEQGDVTVPEP